jgi:hypothetical protein
VVAGGAVSGQGFDGCFRGEVADLKVEAGGGGGGKVGEEGAPYRGEVGACGCDYGEGLGRGEEELPGQSVADAAGGGSDECPGHGGRGVVVVVVVVVVTVKKTMERAEGRGEKGEERDCFCGLTATTTSSAGLRRDISRAFLMVM